MPAGMNLTPEAPLPEQAGEINPGPGIATYFPGIAIAPNKSVVMTYMQSSPDQYVSLVFDTTK